MAIIAAKTQTMKKFFTLLTFAAIGLSANSQRLLVEDFNYATGQLTDDAGGANVSGGNWNAIPDSYNKWATVVEGNLSYPNYFTGPSTTSKQLFIDSLTTGGGRVEDIFRNFTAVSATTNSTIYASFLLQLKSINNLSTNTQTGEYFIAFAPSASATAFRARVFVRKGSAANTVQFGIAPSSSGATPTTVWANFDSDPTATHFITFSYQFVASGNDIVSLYIDKPYSTSAPTPDATANYADGGSGSFADISRIVIRQAVAAAPVANLDAIVVATTYADATLPLNLTSFKANFNGRTTHVKWTTENEVNVSGFAVEKSLDGINFSQIDFVTAKNNSTSTEYSIIDGKVKGGTSYYRLKQIDKNGAYKYSSIEVIKNSLSIKTEVFPNPTRGNLTINHGAAVTGASVKVMNIEGKLIRTIPVQLGSTQTALMVTELVRGNYLLMFENNGTKSITQFSKQ